MLKKILLILLSILLILGCCSCNSNSTKETESTSQTDDGTPADKIVISGETRYRIVYAKDADPAPAKKIYNRLKALDKNAVADDYYTLTTDEMPEDNTPEILVGLTNRKASADAKEALATYLDYSVSVADKKIVIFANTEDRLSDATKYFAGELVKTDSGMIYYPTSKTYVDTYNKYELPSLKLGGAEIKKFSIIISSTATETEKAIASDLQTWIAEKTGELLSIKPDSEKASANEIIIGKTSRPECSDFTDEFAKDVYYSTTLEGTKLLIYAGTKGSLRTAANAFKSKAVELKGDVTEIESFNAPALMKGKKAIFIGNSFIYWGGCVTFIKNHGENEAIRAAGDDKGYFNEICKANGIDMDVYNYTYGGKDLAWIYENKLVTLDKALLESIDYVFISEAGGGTKTFVETIDKINALFPNAEEKLYLGHEHAFRTNDTNTIGAYPKLVEKGMKIVPWGELVCNIYNGDVTVPGGTMTYNKNSFVKNSSGVLPENAILVTLNGKGDNYHENPLAGYITAQMCFASISGSLCEGQKYDFCWDKTIAPQNDFQNFIECQYNNGETTNFDKIFNSPADMLGIQKLMDQYVNKYN